MRRAVVVAAALAALAWTHAAAVVGPDGASCVSPLSGVDGCAEWTARYHGEDRPDVIIDVHEPEWTSTDCENLLASLLCLVPSVGSASVHLGDAAAPSALAVSHDGGRIYVTGSAGTVAYDTGDGATSWTSTGGRDLVVSTDGTRIFMVGANGTTGAYSAASGAELWKVRSAAFGDDGGATTLAAAPDGERVFVTGYGRAHHDGPTAYVTVAYAAQDGNELWSAAYAGPAAASGATALGMSPDGTKLYVTGGSSGVGTGPDYATVAYDAADGTALWVARYDGPAAMGDRASALVVGPDGATVYVTGTSRGAGDDYATLAYDATTGATRWVARYDGSTVGPSAWDRATALDVSPDGSQVFVSGASRIGGPNGHDDYATVAYDALEGTSTWEARYDGSPLRSSHDMATALAVTPDGSRVYVTGGSLDGVTSWDYATVGYDTTTGLVQGVSRYDGPTSGADIATGLGMSPDGSRAFVTGRSAEVGESDYATLAYRVS